MPKVKKLVLGSLLLALLIVVERLLSIQTPILRVSFAYVPLMLGGMLLGPGWSTLIAVLGDLLGMLLFPKASFFIGYTVSAALTGFVYGLFLHNTKTRKQFFARLVVSNLIVLLFVSAGLTSLWIVITLRRAFFVLLPVRLISAAIRFPVETGTMFALGVFLEKPVEKYLYEREAPRSAAAGGGASGSGIGE
ncbi:MAG: folate family ECF transporter S component [Spirochaetaceae bacterium]|jgi:ECF transporter S component (folate family)|nr:folate family ECF transporter S component [Spirochaetaceae bacterium]